MVAPEEVAEARHAMIAAHHRLMETLLGTEGDVTRPSRLKDWSVGHVLTHLARNADSAVRRLLGATQGRVVTQYEGGAQGRAGEIEAGYRRPWAEQVFDLASSSRVLEDLVGQLPDAVWDFETPSTAGELQSGLLVLRRRTREVIIHHTDLGLGFEPDQWPPEMVSELISDLLPTLGDRTDPSELAAWLADRSPAPSLRPWW
jgi:maleylpyruvate isomerase